jgi:hypothetical protein
MKHAFLVILFLMGLCIPGIAQTKGSKQLLVHSGYSIPLQPGYLSDYWDGAVNFGISFTHPLLQNIALQGNLKYHNFLFDDEAWSEQLTEFVAPGEPLQEGGQIIVSGGLKNIIIADIRIKAGKAVFSERVYPYVIAGVGLLHDRTDNLVIGNFELEFTQETRLAYGFGGGLGWSLSDDLTLLLEAYYQHGLTELENDAELPIDLSGVYKKEEISFLYFKIGFGYNL